MAEVVELSQSAAKERAAEEETQETPDVIEVIDAEYAVLIFKGKDGQIVVTPDINAPVSPERQATPDELKFLIWKVLEDIKTQETAITTSQMVLNNQLQLAMRMRDAQLNQQVLDRLPAGLAK